MIDEESKRGTDVELPKRSLLWWVFVPALIGEHVGAGLGIAAGVLFLKSPEGGFAGAMLGEAYVIVFALAQFAFYGAATGAIGGLVCRAFIPHQGGRAT